jgi:hypothetical protein
MSDLEKDLALLRDLKELVKKHNHRPFVLLTNTEKLKAAEVLITVPEGGFKAGQLWVIAAKGRE